MFYIFHGEDTHSQKETLADLTGKLGDPAMLDLNTTRLDGFVPLNQLQQASSAMPFLAKARLVIVSGLFAARPDKSYLKELAAYLPQLPETTRLVFLEAEALPGSHPIVKLAQTEKSGYEKLFKPLEGSQLERWIRQQVEERNGRIAPHAVHLLTTNIGNNLQILENEIEKLTLYKGTAEITGEDVALLSPYLAEASIFDLVDALGNRNSKKASLLLQQKLQEGADPFYLFSMFVRQFRLLIQVKEMVDAGSRPPAISQRLKMHSFVAGKLHQQSAQFSLPQLEQIYRHLLDVDVAVKTGRNDMVTALNLLVAALTAP
ncbi:MAG: DNA polymerase III subunit delta [Anaerolineales bacterium]|nr:DNA polymerase III subunit delta [Anaerolineales bacterium]